MRSLRVFDDEDMVDLLGEQTNEWLSGGLGGLGGLTELIGFKGKRVTGEEVVCRLMMCYGVGKMFVIVPKMNTRDSMWCTSLIYGRRRSLAAFANK